VGCDQAVAARTVTAMPDQDVKRPARLGWRHSRGNRALLGIAAGFLLQVLAGAVGGDTTVRLVVWALAAAIVYAVTAPSGR
jgi:hypothetical protein